MPWLCLGKAVCFWVFFGVVLGFCLFLFAFLFNFIFIINLGGEVCLFFVFCFFSPYRYYNKAAFSNKSELA